METGLHLMMMSSCGCLNGLIILAGLCFPDLPGMGNILDRLR